MKSQRQLQIGENIKRIISEIFLRDDYSVMMNNVITILEADVSPDAKNVKIFIDIFGDSTKHEQIFNKIVENTPHFRYELAKKIDLRFTPEILFVHDKTYQKANLIECLLNQTFKNSDHIIEQSNKPKRKTSKNRLSKTSKTSKK
ncbi:MAG: 30S ribosome-binding factor RbfA [Proteobacteria bacterium]|nr:30S ribosome-binding factor RbfA [Pseudomonadota bacterium]NCA28023.1 30S ribosome-binding factor RbfA [Pseudomonadota bacterium]